MPWTSEKAESAFLAQRLVSPDISRQQMEEEVPVSWRTDQSLMGYVKKYMIGATGVGFVVPPYMAYWERLWGATPIEDLPKYKDMYTFTPYIKASIDVTINLALSNGFELEGGKDEIREWLTDWLDEQNILETLRIIGADMLISGNGYLELCRNENGVVEWLKPLDPVHMRVRRDAYGDVFGYVQLLTFPPVVFAAQDIIHFRWGAKSWWYEFSYGTSQLRSLLLIQALIDDFQTDMATIMKVYTKPMLVVTAGTPENPWADPQLTSLVQAFESRQAATDVFVRGDVTAKVLPSMTKEINVEWWLNYLHRQRMAVLGVPKIFLGESEGTNKATADIVMQEYVTRLRMIEELIGDMLETVLFKQLIESQWGEGVEIPKVKWRPIWEPTIQEKAAYYVALVQNNIAGIPEARLALGLSEEPEKGEEATSAGTALMEKPGQKKIVTLPLQTK
ncbi:MAG: phage portal protein [Candidatus Bathyarchaeia archaeon]